MKKIIFTLILSILAIANFIGIDAYAKAGEVPIGCNENVTIKQKIVSYESDLIGVNLEIPVIEGGKNKAFQNRINYEIEKTIMDYKNNIEAVAKENRIEAEKNNYQFLTHAADTEYRVTYNEDGILSLTIIFYEYTGGAHPMTYQKSYNLNLNEGKVLEIRDLFNPSMDGLKIVKEEITRQIEKNKENYFPEAVDRVKEINDRMDFYIIPGSLVVYFPLYDLAPYAAGFPEFNIPFSVFNGGIKI